MTPARRTLIRLAVAGAVLAVLLWRVGPSPFIDGVQRVTLPALLAATALGVVATICCAWRWREVARGLGAELTLWDATKSCYRSTFLNLTLPLGVAGDVHRGYDHGRSTGDLSVGLRSVAWERSAGQVIQIAVTVLVLLALPSPVHDEMPVLAIAIAVAVCAVWVATRRLTGDGRISRWTSAVRRDLSMAMNSRRSTLIVIAASFIVVACHATTFVLAARLSGVDRPVPELAPLALLVLAAMALPLSLAGWGPREGAAAWAFAAVGLGAAAGLTTAVVYGVLALAASLPGALVLITSRHRRSPAQRPLATAEVVHG